MNASLGVYVLAESRKSGWKIENRPGGCVIFCVLYMSYVRYAKYSLALVGKVGTVVY